MRVVLKVSEVKGEWMIQRAAALMLLCDGLHCPESLCFALVLMALCSELNVFVICEFVRSSLQLCQRPVRDAWKLERHLFLPLMMRQSRLPVCILAG